MESWLSWSGLVERATIETAVWSLFALEVLALISVPSVLLRRRGRPLSALAWLLALLALPALGVISWWAFGRTRIERRLRPHRKRKRAYREVHGRPGVHENTRFDDLLPERATGDYAFSTRHNAVEFLPDGHLAFEALFESVGAATDCIHLLFYIFKLDETGQRLSDLLVEKARQGVTVRVLVDGFGSQATLTKLKRRMVPAGIDFAVFLPSRLRPLHAPRFNFINHRKIVVIDNRTALSGGMNIGKEYESSWRDLMLRVRGPAVAALNHVFLEDWFFATEQAIFDPTREAPDAVEGDCDVAVVSSGPDTEAWIHDAYFLAITKAQQRLWICTPYFIPTSSILTALRTAAGRGVDVRLIVPNLSDVRLVSWASRSYYPLLLSAGVRIFEYLGPMLHAKALLMDNLSSIGTANIDHRSLRLNFEVCCFVDSPVLGRELTQWMEELLRSSKEQKPELIRDQGKLQSLGESLAHLLSPLL